MGQDTTVNDLCRLADVLENNKEVCVEEMIYIS